VEGGWLIVSPCETSQVHLPQFKAVNFGDAIFYRKPSPGTEKLQTGGSEPKIHHTQFPELAPLPAKPPSGPPLPFSAFRPPTAGRKTDYEEAVALYDRGLYPEAEKTLATFLSSNQENAKATVLLCRIRANQGKLAEARRLLEKVMATDKLNPGLYYLLAMILQEQGANKEASVSLKRALYLDQNLVLAHIALANLALKQGRVEEYRKYLENALSILGGYESDEILPESEGMTVGRLKKLIGSMDVMGERDEK
jgi:chemotaxis protein methyltransferase CheR